MSVLISHNVIIKIQRGIGLGLPRLMENNKDRERDRIRTSTFNGEEVTFDLDYNTGLYNIVQYGI